MQLTRAADYAVRVLIHLAALPPGKRVNRTELARAGDVPEHFMGKVLQALTRTGILRSHRGIAGGFSLAAPASALTLLDVVEALEGPVALNVCLEPGDSCERKVWCPAHRVWIDAQAAMVRVLKGATIAGLAAEAAPQPIAGGK